MTTNDDPTTPNAETTPTLADALAIIVSAPLPALVAIRDALQVMRDHPAGQVVDDHHQRRPRPGWWRRRQRGKSSH